MTQGVPPTAWLKRREARSRTRLNASRKYGMFVSRDDMIVFVGFGAALTGRSSRNGREVVGDF